MMIGERREPPATMVYMQGRCSKLRLSHQNQHPPLQHQRFGSSFLWRPTVCLRAGAAHEHCPLGVAEPVGVEEGLDGLLVVDNSEGACPVRAPQAAIEAPSVEHTGERAPDIRKRIRLA